MSESWHTAETPNVAMFRTHNELKYEIACAPDLLYIATARPLCNSSYAAIGNLFWGSVCCVLTKTQLGAFLNALPQDLADLALIANASIQTWFQIQAILDKLYQ